MADNGRKSAADGKRQLAESSTTEEEAMKCCDLCHGPLKNPVYQLGASGQRVACSDCGAGQCRSPAYLAVDIVSRHLGYFKVPCPYKDYGCDSSMASRDAAAHAAACAHAPCACPECDLLGSPAQLVRHLTDPAGAHRHWTVTKFTYGDEFPFAVNMLEEPRQDRHLLVAEEDGAVFLLALSLGGHGQVDPDSGRVGVLCVRGNADAGQVYGCTVVVECSPGIQVCTTLVMPSCSAPGEMDLDAPSETVFPFSLEGEEELHLRVRIDRRPQGYRGIPIRFRLPHGFAGETADGV